MDDFDALDALTTQLATGSVDDAWPAIIGTLARSRAGLEPALWRERVRASAAVERLRRVLRREPFTQRALGRPRGAPWDALSTDLACGIVGPPDDTDARSAACHAYLRAGPLCQSIRRRRELAGEFLDEICGEHHFPRVLALGCGHARELALSRLFALGRVGDFCAVDPDVESLRLLERVHNKRVRTIPAEPVKFIAAGPLQGLFHAIYGMTLAEQLDDAALATTLPGLLRLLRPGSRLLLASASPELPELGYIEAVLDWWPVCRTGEALAARLEQAGRDAGLRVEVTSRQEDGLGWVAAQRTG